MQVKSLIVGHGGREAAIGQRMAESSSLFVFGGHRNPTLDILANETCGELVVGDVCDGPAIAEFASKCGIDIAFVSSDDPLAAGVVDALAAAGIRTVGPKQEGARIEWDKTFCRDVVNKIAPSANPEFAIASSSSEVDDAITGVGRRGSRPVAVKPIGLAGGKGVKVVGPHLRDNDEAASYAKEVVSTGKMGGAVVIEEKIEAPEFTIQAMTDGEYVLFPGATYDYPYRFEGDTGPGTGGMGSVSVAGGLLPFLSAKAYEEACEIVQSAIDFLRNDGRHFSGCMNAGFFATPEGVKVIEFNSRFGDPEALNVMARLESDWTEVLFSMSERTLRTSPIKLKDLSTVVTYLVSPEYAVSMAPSYHFDVDLQKAASMGANVCFSAAEADSEYGRGYKTVGTSRAVAFVATDPDLGTAMAKGRKAIEQSVEGPLEWRADIGVLPGAAE